MTVGNYAGTGLYTIPEAARIAEINGGRLSRWVFGHKRKDTKTGKIKKYPPIWKSEITGEIADQYDEKILSFRDLLEARALNTFTEHAIPTKTLRQAHRKLREAYDTQYPLASNPLKTGAAQRLYETLNPTQNGHAILTQKQIEAILKKLTTDIDFDDNNKPLRWWIDGRKQGIMLSPGHSRGRPIDSKAYIPAEVFYGCAKTYKRSYGERYRGKKHYEEIAIAYRVPVETVKRCHDFYKRRLA